MDISEKKFEEAMESSLLGAIPSAGEDGSGYISEPEAPYGRFAPGGYRKRLPEDYDRGLCLDPDVVLDFIYATQPRQWEKSQSQQARNLRSWRCARPAEPGWVPRNQVTWRSRKPSRCRDWRPEIF